MKTAEEIKAEIIKMMTLLERCKRELYEPEYVAIYSHQLLILNSLLNWTLLKWRGSNL